MNEQFKPGDTVIWWKRIPGGNYVYPAKATVIDVTAKRVKIEADDDGRMVIRYVKPQSLQQQNRIDGTRLLDGLTTGREVGWHNGRSKRKLENNRR